MTMKRLKRLFIVLIPLSLISACSMISIAYDNAPSFVAGEFDDAFDLDSIQSEQLEASLQRFFQWHRDEELQRYQQLLDAAARNAADGITAGEILRLVEDLRSARRRALERALDDFGGLAASLSPAQIEHFERYYREDLKDDQAYLQKSLQQREIYRVERNLDRLQKWFGGFDESLETRVRARLLPLPDIYEPWIQYREARHKAVVAALNDNSDPASTQARLKRVLLDPDTDYSRRFHSARNEYWRAYAAAIEDINGWLDKHHRRAAIDRLQRYARVISNLNGEG